MGNIMRNAKKELKKLLDQARDRGLVEREFHIYVYYEKVYLYNEKVSKPNNSRMYINILGKKEDLPRIFEALDFCYKPSRITSPGEILTIEGVIIFDDPKTGEEFLAVRDFERGREAWKIKRCRDED